MASPAEVPYSAPMPARKRHRRQPEHPDPLVRFGRALKEAEEREAAERKRAKAERAEAKRRAQIAAERALAVKRANRRLERAITALKRARAEHRGVPEAELAYRTAKAHVMELETGERPKWAPDDVSDGAGDTGDTDDGGDIDADDARAGDDG